MGFSGFLTEFYRGLISHLQGRAKKQEIEKLKGELIKVQRDAVYIKKRLHTLHRKARRTHIKRRIRRLERKVENIEAFSNEVPRLKERLDQEISRISGDLKGVAELSRKNREELSELGSKFQQLNIETLQNTVYRAVLAEMEKKLQKPIVDTMSIPSVVQSPTVDTKVNFNNLTTLEKRILMAVGRLSNENGVLIPFNKVVFDLFPEREYEKVYSTVSEYLSLLASRNIVKRVRRGNKTYISLTPEAGSHIKELRRKIVDTVGKFVDTV